MIEYNNEEYLIEKIESSLVFFSRYVVQKMIASKTVSAICAGDIKEMVERLTDLMKQTLVPVNQAIEQYYSMELRFPLSVFSGIVGKNRLESLLYLLSDESLHKYRNNPFYRKICKQDTLLLSYECVVMASYMEALKDIRSRYRVVCTEQVKAQLISDIDELLRNIRDEKQRGSLSLNEGSLSYMQIKIPLWETYAKSPRSAVLRGFCCSECYRRNC